MAQAYDFASIGGPAAMMPPEIQAYTEREARFLPRQVIVGNGGYVILAKRTPASNVSESKLANELNPLMDVQDCVFICQQVLNLKIQEIAKLLNISRATLDLHRKGKVKDFSPYVELAQFAIDIEKRFTKDIHKVMRSVLIERKTLIQHMLYNRNELSNTLPYFYKASSRIQNTIITQTRVNPQVAASRLANVKKRTS